MSYIDEFKRTAGKTDRVTNRTFSEREINLCDFLKEKNAHHYTIISKRIQYIIKKKHKISKRFKVYANLFDFLNDYMCACIPNSCRNFWSNWTACTLDFFCIHRSMPSIYNVCSYPCKLTEKKIKQYTCNISF